MDRSIGSLGLIVAVSLLLAACQSGQVRELPPEPAPAPAPPVAQASSVRLSADALFAFGRADITDDGAEAEQTLAALAARLATAERVESVQVLGYTDRIGSDSYNEELSRQRAEAVRAFLVERGIAADVIAAEGRGKADAIVDCPDLRGRALIDCLAPNRRVEINIVAVE
ncbi:OmpA family protein [Coralloluteibacterium stylophorae]|uniref:OmpA family protein n=1 Tax=Coralloluteibacterium stylophorae TaxID=1776034 RepID=A0A8J7VYZ0_9GAMM|nr:OmpA family protein [Coralloluteibacterium stylophorae]MBS7455830.1 OmpA family protein [Coralloluteibacterium stylophorae]